MNRKLVLLVALIALAFFILSVANVSADCVSDPHRYSFRCGDRVNESCTMDHDERPSGNCFIIVEKNLVLDCAGYRMESNGSGIGIEIKDGLSNVTVKNCYIASFNQGFYIKLDSNVTLFNNSVRRNMAEGIDITSCNYTNITNNIVYENGDEGIYLEYGLKNTLKNNTVYSNGIGLNLYSTANDTVTENTVHNNNEDGFKLFSANYSNLTSNVVYENELDFHLKPCFRCSLINNTAHNSRGGFYLESNSSYNILYHNIAYNESSSTGFVIAFGNYNNLTNNKAYNSNNGFGLTTNPASSGPTNNNLLMNNEAYNNDGDGFSLSSFSLGITSNNTLFNNSAHDNNNGFTLSGSSNTNYNNFTGNTAHDNDYQGFWIMGNRAQYTTLVNNVAYSNSRSGEPSAGFVISSINTMMVNNSARGNLGGIAITFAENVTMTMNTMDSNNFYNFALWGNTDAQHNHSISGDNMADGKPIFYLKNGNNRSISIIDPATFYCIWCDGYYLRNMDISHEAFGVYFWNSNNSGVDNITATYTYNLIRLGHSSNNTFNNIVMGANYVYDFESSIGFSNWTLYAERDSLNNVFNNFSFGTTTANFIASDIVMRQAPKIIPPSRYVALNRNLEAEDNSGSGSGTPLLFLNISYTDSDIESTKESSLFIARNNGTWERNTSAFANPFGINAAENYVYANITSFGSDFGILGISEEERHGGGGGGSSYIHPVCGDGVCDARRESYLICPQDCKAPQNPPTNVTHDCGDLNSRGCEYTAEAKDIIKFKIKGQQHTLQIDGINGNQVTLFIWSEPLQATINSGETKEFDLDSNGQADFMITLDNVLDGKAKLLLKALTEQQAQPSQPVQPQLKQVPPLLWIVLACLIVIIIAIVLLQKRNKHLRRWGHKV